MIKIIIFQLLIFSVLNAKSTYQDEFLEGNIHMENSKYIDAIKKYESILEKGYQSSNILYNLGLLSCMQVHVHVLQLYMNLV